MKKILLISILVVLALAVSVSAVGDLGCNIKTACSADEFGVLKFAGRHASLIDASTYTNIVCCKKTGDLDSVTVLTGINLDTTKGIVRLSSNTNAHVELFNRAAPNYNTLIKFDTASDIVCSTKAACASDESCLFSTSADTNAAIGDCNTFSTRKNCCLFSSVANACTLTKAEWRFSNGSRVNDLAAVPSNTNLKLYVEATGNCNGKKANLDLILKHYNLGHIVELERFGKFKKLRDFINDNNLDSDNHRFIDISVSDNRAEIATELSFPLETSIFAQENNIFKASATYRLKIMAVPVNTIENDDTDLSIDNTRLFFKASASPGINSQEIKIGIDSGSTNDECDSDLDCQSTNAPICNNNNKCTGCSGDIDCKKFDSININICDSTFGNCVQCLDYNNCQSFMPGKVCFTTNICGDCDNNIINNRQCPVGEICDEHRICVLDTTTASCTVDGDCQLIDPLFKCLSSECRYPPAETQTSETPKEQPFPIYDWFNFIASLITLTGYYLRKKLNKN